MNPKLKFLLIAPLVLIPLITLLAWASGVGKGIAKPVAPASAGLNTQLPEPQPSNGNWLDKGDFYKKAEQDSARYITRKGEDQRAMAAQRPDSNTAKVYSSLAKLQEVLKHTVSVPPAVPVSAPPPVLPSFAPPATPNPELLQLSSMLDKVMAIQHPEHAATTRTSPPASDTIIDTVTAIEAITETEGTLTSGSVIALRISADSRWHGLFLPRNTLVYGTAALENDRLRIRVRSIRMGDMLCSVSLEAYDLDGMPGIYVPGSLGRDASKTSADEAIGSLNVGDYDPTVSGQATNAGIQALKSLLSKKVKEVRVTLRAGYIVLLKNSTTL